MERNVNWGTEVEAIDSLNCLYRCNIIFCYLLGIPTLGRLIIASTEKSLNESRVAHASSVYEQVSHIGSRRTDAILVSYGVRTSYSSEGTSGTEVIITGILRA